MKITELDLSRKFKRKNWGDWYCFDCDCDHHCGCSFESFSKEDIQADDWENEPEEPEEVKEKWYKHYYGYRNIENGYWVTHTIVSKKRWAEILNLFSAILIDVDREIEKPGWVE